MIPNFTDKVLMILLRNRGADVTNLRYEARLEEQGGRQFVVGKVCAHPSQKGPFDHVENAVAWDEVAEYMVFNSVDEFVSRMAPPSKRKWF